MLITDFDYELPTDLIAQEPLEKRQDSRMLVLDRRNGSFIDDRFRSLLKYLQAGDVLALNNTRVFPARLLGKTETGAGIELLLINEIKNGEWQALGKPLKRLKPGRRIDFGKKLFANVLKRTRDDNVIVRFEADGDFNEILDKIGRTPLPPYIKRSAETSANDRKRYQTVYAARRGAIAAPTAGLHFTEKLLGETGNAGVEIAEITLHVGYGTFEPVRVEDVNKHKVAAEYYEISEEASEKLNHAKKKKRRIIAVGTTTTRALEFSLAKNGRFKAEKGSADLTIVPGFHFRAVDALLTNFHLPKSSLLVLVSAFAGKEFILDAYRHAAASRYRFYSYGDCMLIL